jgi:hypothetical protein
VRPKAVVRLPRLAEAVQPVTLMAWEPGWLSDLLEASEPAVPSRSATDGSRAIAIASCRPDASSPRMSGSDRLRRPAP